MQVNIEEMLQELVKFDRKTNDKVKVEKMIAVVSGMIRTEILQRRYAALMLQFDEPEGHA